MTHQLVLTASTVALLVSAPSASAFERGYPGSLLLFPEYDTAPGKVCLITVTNTEWDLGASTIDTRWVYVDGDSCSEFDRTESLTPGDTLTVVASTHNPELSAGYLYVYAVDPLTNEPMTHNYLIGQAVMMDGLAQMSYATEPFAYDGIAAADLNGDGLRNFDGNEYEEVSDEIIIPRFFGQGAGYQSELILIDLTGGSGYSTTAEMLIYNDNEEVFSSEYTFSCWDRVALTSVSGIFDNSFLHDFTFHDPNEILGVPSQESGWFRVKGHVAASAWFTLADPAVLAYVTERSTGGASSLPPGGIGLNSNGSVPPQYDYPDCDGDGIPDFIELENGLATDCNANGIPDNCEFLDDCNQDGIPDICDPGPDCNFNGVPDYCEPDCDGDGLPDDCEEDCNNNGTPDDCEQTNDCNFNGIPDDCELIPDCNANGIPDECEPDCNGNGIPDDCENLDDCNGNGIPDECERFPDCNGNGVPDECDPDADGDGIPDECDLDCGNAVTVELWPPNHDYVAVDLASLVDPLPHSDLPADLMITSITQDEPINGTGDGDTTCDGTGVGTGVAMIRAERKGDGNGRVYQVNFTATGPFGQTCSGSILVTVPHSQNGQPAVDDGQVHDSSQNCQ